WEIGISSTARSYLRGRCSRTSRTVSIPSARSRLASEAPTPGSVVTGSASMRSGAVQPRGRGHSFWTTPAKPVCIRVIVITGTEDRTRTGRTLRDRDLDLGVGVLEPEEADGARPRMSADDRPERGRDIDLRLR